jgi:polyisoprenyl-teichoic acid--peptidoglycan teichoic acid transferase
MVDPAVRKAKRRKRALIVLAVLGVLVVAAVAGTWWWLNSQLTKVYKVNTTDPELAKMFENETPPPPGQPFYIIMMGSDTRKGEKQQRSDTLIVARIDPKKKNVRMISIPRDTRVDVPGVGMTKINAAAFFGGPALTIKTVKQFTGVPIKYFVNVDFTGFRDVVNSIGGVWINVPYDIDDRQASAFGSKYQHIKKGYQKLNGYYALTFVRARHQFADQDFTRVKNQQMFIKALAKQTLQLGNVFRAPAIISAVADHVQTNMPASKMAELVMQFKGMGENDIESATMPGVPDFVDGQSFVVTDDMKWEELLAKFKSGKPIVAKKSSSSSSTASSGGPKIYAYQVPVSVRNGTGVSGLAKQCSDFLASKGFTIKETGNMNQSVYPKTIIVYSKGNEAKANFVREKLGFGDVIAQAGMYSFKTPVLVIVGKDWKNPATTSTRRP